MACLTTEPTDEGRVVGVADMEDLHGDVAIEDVVVRPVHDGHAALADRREQPVAAREDLRHDRHRPIGPCTAGVPDPLGPEAASRSGYRRRRGQAAIPQAAASVAAATRTLLIARAYARSLVRIAASGIPADRGQSYSGSQIAGSLFTPDRPSQPSEFILAGLRLK